MNAKLLFIILLFIAVFVWSDNDLRNDIVNVVKSVPAISQISEDKLVSDCRLDFIKYADIGESKTSKLDISIVKIEKITNNQTAKEFFELYGSGSLDEYKECEYKNVIGGNKKCNCSEIYQEPSQLSTCEYCCAYYTQDFPFVFIAAKSEIEQNGITFGSTKTYVCNSNGLISKWAKSELIH
ncbi:MAG: hypothetical protein V1718_02260 [archaeon]